MVAGATRVAVLSAAGTVAVALVVAGAVVSVRAGEALPDVALDGRDVAGLGADDLRDLVADRTDARAAEPLALEVAGTVVPIDPVAVGAAPDAEALVDELLSAGRDGFGAMLRRSLFGGSPIDVDLETVPDEDAVRDAVEDAAAAVDVAVDDGAVRVDPATLEVVARAPADGLAVDVDVTVADVVAALTVGADAVTGTTVVLEAVVPPSSVAEVAALAARAVEEPLTLTGGDGEVVLDRRDVAALVSSRRRGTDREARLELAVTEQAADEVLRGLVGALLTEPVPARLDPPRLPPVRFDERGDASWSPVRGVPVPIVPGVTGTRFDPVLAAAHLEQVLASGRRTAELRLAPVEPDVTTAEARAVGVDTLLSTYTTYHACCQARVANIQRLADVVDGTVVAPGEQFSINQLSGVRTCEKGYAEAGMILDGEIVASCGGGVSQFGTSTVNAVFFAGLEPDAYKPHSFYISRYPLAREATLNYPSPDIDVRFTNTTPAPIVVRTSYTPTSITVSFYGRSDVEEVRADVGSPTAFRDFGTRRRADLTLPPGTERVVQTGSRGFRVALERTVVREDGSETTDDWSNTYSPVIEVVLFNPNPAPSPPPGPSPSPSPSPSAPGDDAPDG